MNWKQHGKLYYVIVNIMDESERLRWGKRGRRCQWDIEVGSKFEDILVWIKDYVVES